jgi:hypothetical protein
MSPLIKRSLAALACVCIGTSPVVANVITDWDETGVTIVAGISPYAGQRLMTMMHVAMFDAVNSIERRYRPYLAQLPAAPDTSKEAAAAAAAGAILATVNAKSADKMKSLVASYLGSIPDDARKADAIALGQAVAARVLEARDHDGADAPDAYRPRTTAGVYVPTAITAGSMWPGVKPFALNSGSQFRPGPPIALKGDEWATNYNELKEYGGKASVKRSPQQTETARFWLMVGPGAYHPFARQLVNAKQMSVVDSARFMTLVTIALNDAYIAVLDAKYHYNFWRPITAIRNGDIDENPATARDATWQPIDVTPMHPEYPCAHCIASGAVGAVVEALLGTADIPEVAMTSPTAPGVTHRWTNTVALADEVANARIWAGFHYRFSTRVGSEMGRRVGEHAVRTILQANNAVRTDATKP